MKPVIVQLPFPSQTDPNPLLDRYYQAYSSYFASIVPGFRLRQGDLWEAPLWVAHLDAAIGQEDTEFRDLSLAPHDDESCCERLVEGTEHPALYLFSPLAQNFDLAMDVSERLISLGHTTVLGGNMVGLERPGSFSKVYSGHARRGFLEGLTQGREADIVRHGRQPAAFGYRPNYRHLSQFANRVPLVRINASHGCLFACSFCGDAWSRQLHIVAADDLKSEFEDIARYFPQARLFYVGDKTFGQSKEAVANLIAARPDGNDYTFIVQTHVQAMSDWLIDRMEELGVRVVEMGFETADGQVLRQVQKRNEVERYLEWIERLDSRGIHVILNLLGGLPYATEISHLKTMAFLDHASRHAALFNLYNFVPYPKTPVFPELRSRIVDWNFANWREDRPGVFTPYHQSASDLWEHFQAMVARCDTLVRGRIGRERAELRRA